MSKVTKASIAYAATHVSTSSSYISHLDKRQVRFALSSASVFSRTDKITDSECFYNSILSLLDQPAERGDVAELLLWWNRWCRALNLLFLILTSDYSQVFPKSLPARRAIDAASPLARIAAKRASASRSPLGPAN